MRTRMLLAAGALACASLVGCGGSALHQGTISTVTCTQSPGGGGLVAEQAYPGMSADEIMERVTAFDTPAASATNGGTAPLMIDGETVTAQEVSIAAADGFAFANCGSEGSNGQMNFVLH